ncbi:hypothetical protein IJT93_08510 [bacterium]|nr:hypothetical protein [bacterium]
MPDPAAPAFRPKLDPEVEELLQYLDGVLNDYGKYIAQIGSLKYTAPQLLYYRDEVQDLLEALAGEKDLDLKPYWQRLRDYDLQLRAKATVFVQEVGHSNFKQYQIINNPPLNRWWWYLNRTTANLAERAPSWQWWRSKE